MRCGVRVAWPAYRRVEVAMHANFLIGSSSAKTSTWHLFWTLFLPFHLRVRYSSCVAYIDSWFVEAFVGNVKRVLQNKIIGCPNGKILKLKEVNNEKTLIGLAKYVWGEPK